METRAGAPPSLPSAIKFMRRVWLLMVGSILVLAATTEMFAPSSRHPAKSFFESITVVAILCAVGWAVLRRKYVGAGRRQLARDPKDTLALRRWQTGRTISFMMSEAVALYGLNLRYAGFTLSEVLPFYAAGLILMIFSAPRPPSRKPQKQSQYKGPLTCLCRSSTRRPKHSFPSRLH